MAGWEAAADRLGPGAEWYAKTLGWKVFPCWGIVDGRCGCARSHPEPKDVGKHPHGRLVPNGMLDSTVDVEQIREWWRGDPDSNIGVECAGSGFLVVDIDPRHGGVENWPKIVEIIEKEGGSLPRTVEAITGEYTTKTGAHRGRHLYFRVEDGESLRGGFQDYRGIDIKHKGYVLAAPSRHGSGMIYEWAPGCAPWEREMAYAPDELLALIRKRPRRAGGGVGGGAEGLGLGVLEWGGERVDLDAVLEAGIPEGERAVTLYRVACAVANKFPVDTEMGRAAVRSIMRGVNSKYAHPPLDWDDELGHQVERAIEFVKDNPKLSLADSLAPGLLEWAEAQKVPAGGSRAGVSITREELEGTGGESRFKHDPAPASELSGGMPLNPADTLPPDIDDWGDDTLPDGTPARRTLTDRGNAQRLVDYYGNTVRYTPGLGWFIWSGDHWRRDPEGDEVLEKAQIVSRLVQKDIVHLDAADDAVQKVIAFSTLCKSASKLKDARTLWKVNTATTRAPVEFWDSNPEYLGVKNGVIDLRSGELLAATPSMGISKRTDVAYTPGYRNLRWQQFLDFATDGDIELQEWLQRAAGYTLTGLRRYDVLFLVYGAPGSGKSTFLEAVQTALGSGYAVSMPSHVLVEDGGHGGASSASDYFMADLIGRRMAVFSEWPAGKRTREDTVKRLTGDLSISARPIHQAPITFTSQAKLWIGTNARPRVEEEAMWRRIRAIPFLKVPEKPDPGLKEFLTHPDKGLPAVLSWAVDGAVKLLNSSERDALGWCTAVAEASAEYRRSEDRIGLFLEEETLDNPGASVPVKVLHDVSRGWFEDRGERPMTAMSFRKALEERGLHVVGFGRDAILQNKVLRPRAADSGTGTPDWGDLASRFRA